MKCSNYSLDKILTECELLTSANSIVPIVSLVTSTGNSPKSFSVLSVRVAAVSISSTLNF